MKFAWTMASCAVAAAMLGGVCLADGEGGPKPPRPKTVVGTLVKIDADSITLGLKSEGSAAREETLKLSPSAQITMDAAVGLADVKAGQLVTVRRKAGGEIRGKVVKADAQSLTLAGRARESGSEPDQTIAAADIETIVAHDVTCKALDLKAGQRVGVTCLDGVVSRVEAPLARSRGREGDRARGPRADQTVGEVVKVEGDKLTIKMKAGDGGATRDETFTLTGKVKVLVDGKAAAGGDLKAGQTVRVTHRKGEVSEVETPWPRPRKAGGEGEDRGREDKPDRPRREGREGESKPNSTTITIE